MSMTFDDMRREAGMTKWAILKARQEELQRQADKIARELTWMEGTTFGRPCCTCGEDLPTEADFAQHFIIDDSRYLGLGHCPSGKVNPLA